MGQVTAKRRGPSRAAEVIVGILIPPACREEVLGDLHERYASRLRYAGDALATVPLVILSRIRRTLEPRTMLMQAFVAYLSFLCAARLGDREILGTPWGLMRLAVPAVMSLLGLILDDAYARRGPRSRLNLARGPVLGQVFALVSQEIFRISSPELALPRIIVFCGCAMSLVLSFTVRTWFPPGNPQLQA